MFTGPSATILSQVLVRVGWAPYRPEEGRRRKGTPMSGLPAPLRPPFSVGDFGSLELARARWSAGTTVSVALPARNEAPTVGAIVRAIHRDLVEAYGLVDEIVVLDDGSTDRTAEEAVGAGARVETVGGILPHLGRGEGKGDAMWRSLFVTRGDVVCWIDADIRNFRSHLVAGLIGPLLLDPEIVLVKGFFRRPADGLPHGGGRVTELVARPLISKLFPGLAGIVQPLSGFTAGRRGVLEAVPFLDGWGVEFGLLVDVAAMFGVDRLAQVDLGSILHDRATLRKLAPQALAVLTAALRRAGLEPSTAPECSLATFDDEHLLSAELVSVGERPPARSVDANRQPAAGILPA
jgi:glucosyl-3-phosphoglycerate synthase